MTGAPFTITVVGPAGTEGLTAVAYEVDQPIDPDEALHNTMAASGALGSTPKTAPFGTSTSIGNNHAFSNVLLVANTTQSAITHTGMSALDGVHTFNSGFQDLSNDHVVGESLWRNANPMVFPDGAQWTLTAPADSASVVVIFYTREVAPNGWMELRLIDLDGVLPTQLVSRVVNEPFVVGGDYFHTPYGYPGPNYLCEMWLGYAGLAGPCEGFLIEAIPPPAMPEAVFDPDEAPIGLTWVEFTDAAGGFHVWSNIALPDPPEYDGGYKAHRIIEFGPIRRGLSNIDGQYEGIVWFWTMNG